MRPLRQARIGYAGYSPDLSAPGDRRRFVAYAKARGLSFESARLDRDYDMVLLTHNGDIPGWTARKRREGDRLKLIFELIDSYFVRDGVVERFAKGIARRIVGQDSRLSPDFLRTLTKACAVADAVICSTEEQAAQIRAINPNVVLSFDDFSGEPGDPKTDYSRGKRLRLVWEGQSTTLANLQAIRAPLNALKDRVELHIVSDPIIPRFLGRFGARPAIWALDGIECPIVFHEWRRDSFARHITAADVAIIPIDRANRMAMGKPDNKLILLWKLGIPVLASATPAYARAMERARIDMLCESGADWRTRLEALAEGRSGTLVNVARKGQAFAERCYSEEEFARRFDAAFALAGFAPSAR